jgi:hypothetical protein
LYEKDLETAIINHLQTFLLEMGRGFSFVARQKRISFDGRDFYIVCNYTREIMNEGDNPPIGIILCADKSDAIVRYTLAEDNKQIFASKYMLYLPTEQELKNEIYAIVNQK